MKGLAPRRSLIGGQHDLPPCIRHLDEFEVEIILDQHVGDPEGFGEGPAFDAVALAVIVLL